MPYAWQPKVKTIQDDIAEEQARIDFLKMSQEEPVWSPPVQNDVQDLGAIAPEMSTPENMMPAVEAPIRRFAPMPQTVDVPPPPSAPPAPTITPPVPDKPSKELDPLHPFKVDEDLPLWAKTINVLGKPFELIQEYALDPLMATVHLPFTGKLSPTDERKAKQEGILSYFPGGIRHKAYEDLKYPMKWAVEMLPWIIVPPIGAVAKGTGIAGALAKAGTAGKVAGKALEMSPAGLMEKGTVALFDKIGKTISVAKDVVPVQKTLTKEFQAEQWNRAGEILSKGEFNEKRAAEFLGALKGKAERAGFEAVGGKLSKAERDEMAKIALEYSAKDPDKMATTAQALSGWNKVLGLNKETGKFDLAGIVPNESELVAMEKVFGSGITKALVDKSPKHMYDKIVDVLNAPRSLLSSVDLSGLLRQGAILTARHPIQASKTVIPMIKAFFSDNSAKYIDDAIRARPNFWRFERYGGYRAPLPNEVLPKLAQREEAFVSRIIEKMPVIGGAIKASNRAYATVLNDIRSRTWESTLDAWKKSGMEITNKDYESLAKLINAASGRGNLPKVLSEASPLLSSFLFSPRLFWSRIELPSILLRPNAYSPAARKEAAKMLASFLGAGTAIVGMASALGAKTSVDPRNADFGKIVVGNTRLDVWSGYSQWARFVAQVTTGQKKSQYGNVNEVNRKEVLDRFIQSKLSPAAGLINDILKGESYAGEEMDLEGTNVTRQLYARLIPLFIQDLIDAVEQDNLVGGVVSLPGLFGVGVTTYLSSSQKLRDKLAQEKYNMSWEQVGQQYGIAAQMDLERSSPEMLAEVEKERADYDKTIMGKQDVNNIYRGQTETIEKEYRNRVNLAALEYRETGDGYTFKEKINDIASNRRSQYDILNKDPQFAKVVARYNEVPTPNEIKKMNPQDIARREYMRMMYSDDMYDRYGNYRFDMAEDMRQKFVEVFGEGMLTYVETYQGIKENDMPEEYQQWRQAQKILKPYWQVQSSVENLSGKSFAESPAGQRFIQKQRKVLRATNPDMARAYTQFYTQL
jgi:hypothetical protein